jgi:predicted RNase H-like HicB family nuclease
MENAAHIELSREHGDFIPEAFDGEYRLVFRFDAECLQPEKTKTPSLYFCSALKQYRMTIYCNVILELGKDGYGVWFEKLPHVFSFGETVEAAKADAKAALEGYIIALNKCNQVIPEILQGEYE